MSAEPQTAREALTREAIVDAALQIGDTEGLEAVSLRRVASSLGVTAMALYRYISSKEELLGAMMDRVFGEFELPAERADGDWRELLREFGRAFRRLLLAHPAAAELYFGGLSAIFPNGLRIVEPILELITRAGFSPEQAGLLEMVLERNVLALVLFETRAAAMGDAEQRRALFDLRRQAVNSLPADQFPRVIESAGIFCGDVDPEVAFEFALDLMIAGVEKLLERSA